MKMTEKKWQGICRLATAGCLMLLVANRASAQEAGRYQWTMAPRDSGVGSPIVPYMFDSVTGEIAKWDASRLKWIPDMKTTPVDWDDVRKQREAAEKRLPPGLRPARLQVLEEPETAQAEHQAKRDVLFEELSKKSLEEQVAWARHISLYRYVQQSPSHVSQFQSTEILKVSSIPPFTGRPTNPKGSKEDVFVGFTGMLDDGTTVRFFLSSTAFDNKTVFPAPPTIVEDVKAEVKRQGTGLLRTGGPPGMAPPPQTRSYSELRNERLAQEALKKREEEQQTKEALERLAAAAATEAVRKQKEEEKAKQEEGE